MGKYEVTPEAVGDLFDIWNFIAKDNPEAADRVEATVFRAFEFLVERPLAGRARKDLTLLPLRFWVVQPYSNYLIVYEHETRPLRVIRIVHAARNLPNLLK